uniref:Nuclear speckle splicing regulatory protein 1 n=2 Tax=Culex pipiens TaxID=7175 RepID=A0A8D8CBG7_CULPI
MEKQYGLIDPKANKAASGKTGLTKHAAFDSSDSDSDGKDAKKSVNLELGDAQKRQARAAQQKALAEDPTVYQYDELYDEMDSKRKEAKVDKSKEERKPKYIGKLLETADKRKKEQERRIERQVQKEREAEGEKFQDKESFVTSAYRAKLEEMKKAEEEEKREEYLESIGDVTKQKDLGGFYRHIYSQKMGEGGEKKEEEEKEKVKEEKPDSEDESKKGGSDDEERARREALKSKDAAGSSKSRRYRKRHSDEGEEDEKNDSSKKVHLQSNLDADSDFSIDSKSDGSSSEESDGDEGGKRKKKRGSSAEKSEPKQDKPEEDRQSANGGVENGAKVKEEKDVEGDSGEVVKSEKKEKKEEKKKEPKIDIWKKRTVGEVFEAAQQRYYERKAARESG